MFVTGYARQVLGLHVTISVFVCIGKVGTMALVVGKVLWVIFGENNGNIVTF